MNIDIDSWFEIMLYAKKNRIDFYLNDVLRLMTFVILNIYKVLSDKADIGWEHRSYENLRKSNKNK